jgi:rubrerythrin
MDAEAFDELILEAISEEIAARDFYRDASRRMKDPGVKAIFERLSDDENDHRNMLEAFRYNPLAKMSFDHVQDFGVSEREQEPPPTFDMSPRDAFRLAMKMEEKAMAAYTCFAEVCTDPELRNLYSELAEMERGHKAKLEELFLNATYPESW